MYPILFRIGPVTVYSYGVALALAFLAGYFVLRRELLRRKMDIEAAEGFVIAAMVGGVLGARLLYVASHVGEFGSAPFSALAFWQAGLSFYGGLIGAAALVILVAYRWRVPIPKLADAVAPSLALGIAIGRLGCFSNGCCNGTPTGLPWAISFTNTLSAARPLGIPLHPAQLYESFASFALFAVLLWLRPRLMEDGLLFGSWLFGYGVYRFLVEFVRVNPDVVFGMSGSQLFSLAIILVSGLVLLTRIRPLARTARDAAASRRTG